MKLTKSKLQQLINEEIKYLTEQNDPKPRLPNNPTREQIQARRDWVKRQKQRKQGVRVDPSKAKAAAMPQPKPDTGRPGQAAPMPQVKPDSYPPGAKAAPMAVDDQGQRGKQSAKQQGGTPQQAAPEPQDLKIAAMGLYQGYITSRGKKLDTRGRANLMQKSMPIFCALSAWSGTGPIQNKWASKVIRMATQKSAKDPELFKYYMGIGKKVRIQC
jgi:hypothetical protein